MSAPAANLRINADRLWDSLMEMAKIGPGVAGGNNRQTLTDEDGEGRHLFRKWCEQAGLTMGVDTMGNMFMTRPGTDPDALPVYVGSHLDTQPTGGKYDGVLGVLAGLELVRTLNDLDIKTRHPIVVVNWTNEEGTRFAPAMLASGVFAGVHEQDWAYDRVDAKGKDIGVVTHGQGLRWAQCTVTGKESHTGSTPMPMRRNAGRGLAQITELVHQIAMDNAPNAVGAIGHIDVYPNSRNIIPGKVVFTIDFRSHELDTLNGMVERLMTEAPKLCDALGVSFEAEIVGQFDPPEFDHGCVKAIRDAADRLGYSHMDIISGAGHDACWINRVAPTAMVMCPCVDGLSHNEAEEISKEWAAAGADVLMHAVVETAGVVE